MPFLVLDSDSCLGLELEVEVGPCQTLVKLTSDALTLADLANTFLPTKNYTWLR